MGVCGKVRWGSWKHRSHVNTVLPYETFRKVKNLN